MRKRLYSLAALAALAAGGGAHAQAQDRDETIVVEGQRVLPPKAVSRHVADITSPVEGQLTQFRNPVCPRVAGFPAGHNLRVEKRIRKAAAEAGVRVAGAPCRANLLLVVARDADAFVEDLGKSRPWVFENLDDSTRRRAFRRGPVHMWNSTRVLNEDGQPEVDGELLVRTASHINLPTQQAILGSTIVIDDDAVVGKTLDQIADYAAMRALSGARPPRRSPAAATILTLFDPAATPPPGLTRIDKSYLKGLYESSPAMRKTSAMGRISRQIRRDMEARAGTKD